MISKLSIVLVLALSINVCFANPVLIARGYIQPNCAESLANDKALLTAVFKDKKITTVRESLIVRGDSYYKCPKDTDFHYAGSRSRCKSTSMELFPNEMPIPVRFATGATIISNALCNYYLLVE